MIFHSLSMMANSRSGAGDGARARMNEEKPHHAERELRHLVVMRVVHVGAVLAQHELVFERLARRDDLLRQAAHAVHAVGQQEAVPVDRGAFRQPVGDVDAHPVALDRLDRRPVDRAVVAPTRRLQAGRELVLDLLRDEVKDLHAIDDFPRQLGIVWRDDRLVIDAGLAGREAVAGVGDAAGWTAIRRRAEQARRNHHRSGCGAATPPASAERCMNWRRVIMTVRAAPRAGCRRRLPRARCG